MAEARTIGFNFAPARNYLGDWERYFEEYNAQLAAFKNRDDDDEEPELPIKVLVPGHSIPGEDLPGNARGPKGIYARLETAGWTLAAQRSETFQEGKTYGPNAQKAGEKTRDRYLIHYWIAGRLGVSQFMAYWVHDEGRNLFVDCLTNDSIFSRVGDMNEWLLERSLEHDEGTEDR